MTRQDKSVQSDVRNGEKVSEFRIVRNGSWYNFESIPQEHRYIIISNLNCGTARKAITVGPSNTLVHDTFSGSIKPLLNDNSFRRISGQLPFMSIRLQTEWHSEHPGRRWCNFHVRVVHHQDRL